LLVTFTLNMLPDRVAATVVALGSCLGPTSYFSRSAFTSARRHSHCALDEMIVPLCMAKGLGSFLLSADNWAPAVALQPAKLFSVDPACPLPPADDPPQPVVPLPAAPPVPVVPPL